MTASLKYKYADLSIWFTAVAACFICCFYTWRDPQVVNFFGGDARFYYYYLQSTFIDRSLMDLSWLKSSNGVVLTHHPIGLSLLLLPFFLPALLGASVFNYPLDGMSQPFQVAVSIAALFYCVFGLVYVKKLLLINGISDKVTAFVIPLIFFGTNLFHYTINESGMSHVYSFALIAFFLYHGCKLVKGEKPADLLLSAAALAMIILVRPNNGLVLFSIFFWFRSKAQMILFFKKLFRSPAFYFSVVLLFLMLSLQPLAWLWKEDTLFVNRYATYGFYWTRPQLIQMLFGFEAGFFIYTPLCLMFLFGLIAVYRENKYFFFAVSAFVLLLFYIFSAYSAYTYFDGLGIRVLIDYYSLFALLGAKLFMQVAQYKVLYQSLSTLALFLVVINLVYCYQGENSILARAGMNYNKWKYIFLKTNKNYQNVLGGSSDLAPYAKIQPPVALKDELGFERPFDFSGRDFGTAIAFDSIGFNSKRIHIKLKIRRREVSANSSNKALLCAMLQDAGGVQKSYLQFPLNETPASTCCQDVEYDYAANMEASFKSSDRLSVYLWNIKKQPFLVDKFSVQVYYYNY